MNELDEDVHHLYVRTHGDFSPGEQRCRSYNWNAANIDPNQFVFGIVDKNRESDGVKKSIWSPDSSSSSTRIVSKQQAQMQMIKDEIGKPRNLGYSENEILNSFLFSNPSSSLSVMFLIRNLHVTCLHLSAICMHLLFSHPSFFLCRYCAFRRFGNATDPDMVFGMPSSKTVEWGTAECLRAEPSAPLVDEDLGRSTRPGFRNDTGI